MPFLDAALFVLLLVGNLLALPIWWWLSVTPLTRLWKWRSRVRGEVASRDGVRNWIGSD